jgi:hypothetical protein
LKSMYFSRLAASRSPEPIPIAIRFAVTRCEYRRESFGWDFADA